MGPPGYLQIYPEYLGDFLSYGSPEYSECLSNIRGYQEVRGCSLGSDILTCKTQLKCQKMRLVGPFTQILLLIFECNLRISPEYSGNIRLNGHPNLPNIHIMFGIFGRISLRLTLPIVGHLVKLGARYKVVYRMCL